MDTDNLQNCIKFSNLCNWLKGIKSTDWSSGSQCIHRAGTELFPKVHFKEVLIEVIVSMLKPSKSEQLHFDSPTFNN